MVGVQPPLFQTDIAPAAIHNRWLEKWGKIFFFTIPFHSCFAIDTGTFKPRKFLLRL
jgi:hypothetical protein